MTDQTNNDSGSRRLRREEERRRQLEELIPRRPIEVPPVVRSGVEPAPADRSPVERGWRDDLAPDAGRPQGRPVDPGASTLSRRELRERSAASAGSGTVGPPPPSVDETWGARRAPAPEPEPYRPDPAPPERRLSRRELRERAEGTASTPAGPRPDDASVVEVPPFRRDASRTESPRYEEPAGGRAATRREASGYETRQNGAPRYDAPRYDAPQYDAPRNDAPRYDAPRNDVPRHDAPSVATPYAEQATSAGWEEPDRPIIRRERGEWTPREPVPNPADLETSGPARPAQPTRASTDSHAFGREGAPERASEPEPQVGPAGGPVDDEPVRVSPLARAAAIRAQAARRQQEMEDAARERYEQLQSRRASQGGQADGQQAAGGQPTAAMWGQRSESNGAAQPAMGSEAANGHTERPPVRRVVLPPSMSAGTSPSDVPVLGLGAGQPQPQVQPQHPAGALPQQYQGLPQGGPMPANGQPFATVTMAPSGSGATQTATAPARPATGGPGGPPNMDGSGPLPRWGTVGAAVGSSPTPSNGSNGQAPVVPPSPTPAALNGARHEPNHAHEPEHDDETAHRHPYTWLHMIVLVLVAFVLGMLIFMLVIKDATADGATADVGQLTAVALAATTEQVRD